LFKREQVLQFIGEHRVLAAQGGEVLAALLGRQLEQRVQQR
jgi:hypothetical protein